jgi:hypothetical protein
MSWYSTEIMSLTVKEQSVYIPATDEIGFKGARAYVDVSNDRNGTTEVGVGCPDEWLPISQPNEIMVKTITIHAVTLRGEGPGAAEYLADLKVGEKFFAVLDVRMKSQRIGDTSKFKVAMCFILDYSELIAGMDPEDCLTLDPEEPY